MLGLNETLYFRMPYNFVSRQTGVRYHRNDVVVLREVTVVSPSKVNVTLDGEVYPFEVNETLFNRNFFVHGAKQLQ